MKLVKQKIYCDFADDGSIASNLHAACCEQHFAWTNFALDTTEGFGFLDYLLDFVDIFRLDVSGSDDPF